MPHQTVATRPAPTVAQAELDDLTARLAGTRRAPGCAATKGVPAARLDALLDRWRTGFDWRAFEREQADYGAALITTTDGRALHYLHAGPAGPAGPPVLLLHGWPDSPLQYRHLIPLLLDAGHAVVAPSAPGFGWSEEPAGELSPGLVADDCHHLMAALGYPRYVVHGTDWGATVGAELASAQPDSVAGLHLLQPPFDRAFLVDRDTASEAERTYLTALDEWGERAVYVSAHTHQADTLAAAFADSPAGLLAWITERYDDASGDNVQDDDLIAAAAFMWLTRSFRSSVRLYSEPAADWDGDADWGEDGGSWTMPRIEVPTAFAIFPDDIGTPPREFTERLFDVQRYTEMPRGGHWAALEEPRLVADDLIAFAGTLDGGDL